MKLREYCEQKLEALGIEPRVKFDLGNGHSVELVHPWLWDDKTQAAFNAAESVAARARAIIGTADHKRLLAAGGSSNELLLAVELMKRAIPSSAEDDADPKDKQS